MKKKFLSISILFFFLLTGCLEAQTEDVWKYKVLAIYKEARITIEYDILLNDVRYVTDSVDIDPSEIENLTVNQKKVFANDKIQERCLLFIKAYNENQKIASVIGTTVTINVP